MGRLANLLSYYFCLAKGELSGRILDAGCGSGLLSFLIAGVGREKREAIELIGVDIYEKFLKIAEGYDHKILCSVTHLPFRDKSIDSSLSIEVIEHLSKKDGIKFLDELERVTRKYIALSTPFGYKKRESPNMWMKHRSGWVPKDFRVREYKIRYLPNFSKKRWMFIPFAIAYMFWIPSITDKIIAFKQID